MSGARDESVTFPLAPIGVVRSSRAEAIDDDWDAVTSEIVLDPESVTPAAVAGLAEFSHVDVIFVFDQVDAAKIETGARRPRGNPDWPEVGILAQRARMRPNRLGVTACRLVGVDGLTIRVNGLDAIEGSPVVDVKPVMKEFLPRGEVSQPTWATELMASYWSRA